MDVGALSQLVTAFLAPFLADLLKEGAKVAGEAAKTAGEEAWQLAAAMWGRLRAGVDARPDALTAVRDVASAPQDSAALTVMQSELIKLLRSDCDLERDLADLWEQRQQAPATVVAHGERSVAVGPGASGVIAVPGDHNVVEVMQELPPTSAESRGKAGLDG